MPFDISLPTDVQNLLKLADALEREHERFRWNFNTFYQTNECGTTGCALGMAMHIGLMPKENDAASAIFGEPYRAAARTFGMSDEEVQDIFSTRFTRRVYGVYHHDVTSAMVAAELRRIAAEKMGR